MGCSTRKLIGFLCGIVDNTSTNPAVPSSNHQPPPGSCTWQKSDIDNISPLCRAYSNLFSYKKKGRTVEEDT